MHPSDSKEVDSSDSNEHVEVTVRLRPRPSSKSLPSAEEIGAMLPKYRHYISREELGSEHGADPQDVERVSEYAQEYGLKVERVDLEQRTVVLSGSAHEINSAFGVKLKQYTSPKGNYRGYDGDIYVERDLVDVIEDVSGLDTRPQARPL